ncbi:MAG: T9SS type A sorting domain-containing protein, partial [Ignavibacteriaceae bacterium]
AVKLSFTAMAAAKTFEDLLPYMDNQEIISNTVKVGSTPTQFKLDNYPNPFNPNTMISYSLPVRGQVKILIYNTLGQQVRVLINEEQEAGQYNIEWNSRNDHNQSLSSGIYILRMEVADFAKDKKIVLLK